METKSYSKEKLIKLFQEKEGSRQVLARKNTSLYWDHFVLSGVSISIASIYIDKPQSFLYILPEEESAQKATDELEFLLGKQYVLYFPPTQIAPFTFEETTNANQVLRTKTITDIQANANKIIITTPKAFYEKIPSPAELQKQSLKLKVGQKIDIQILNKSLFELGFHRVDFVSQPGDFAVRGGIVDVFSFHGENPYRIVFFDQEIEKIKQFDTQTQFSTTSHTDIVLYAGTHIEKEKSSRVSILSILPSTTVLVLLDKERLETQIREAYDKALQVYEEVSAGKLFSKSKPNDIYIKLDDFKKEIESFYKLEVGQVSINKTTINLEQTPQSHYGKRFDLLAEELQDYKKKGYKNIIVCTDGKQASRLHELIQDSDENLFQAFFGEIHQGFIDHELKLLCYTHHQVFGRFHKHKVRNAFVKKDRLDLKSLTNLAMGDYVTHIDYGIGKFAGLKKIQVNAKEQEAIKLVYQNNDILYVNIHSLHKISKYAGIDGKEPAVSKLGSPAWGKLKNKTKAKVKELAFDLIQLYAKRKTKKGFQFAPDSYLQRELEASFIYEDTLDQSSAIEMVKQDMEQEKPMDRLICGDVGFGKTEVAIRAAFKAVDNGKQVAVLVPTTILAFQHYHSFSDRLKDFPVRVEYLNRSRTAKEKSSILKDLKEGKIDILVGTHQIINQNIEFKDLGLLVVDEEHKFGVGVKEKLRTMRENIDTLTLTATPIPRTLQFSLMAARDLSIIKTPPPNRQAIETILNSWNEQLIREAIVDELERGGQVFFIHNRVENIKEIAGVLQRLVPEAKIAIGHGQMEGKKLEKLFLDFMSGTYDILVSTTIIESGLDVSNANTIIINDAHKFGLADLHQMRGRVGRSNKKAYCYLLSPSLDVINKEAKVRLQAIIYFSDLGSGFNIAMKDLEIRGSGDLLGPEQSGFISEMGFDAYQKILVEAVEELKRDQFSDLFEPAGKEKDYVSDFQIDTDIPLYIPDTYVNNVEERMFLYNELNKIEEPDEIEIFSKQLEDRFGPIPYQVKDLLAGVSLKFIAKNLGFEKIILKEGVCLAYFVRNAESMYYKSYKFNGILEFVQAQNGKIQLKEKIGKNKLPYLIMKIEDISHPIDVLDKLREMENHISKHLIN